MKDQEEQRELLLDMIRSLGRNAGPQQSDKIPSVDVIFTDGDIAYLRSQGIRVSAGTQAN